jgi:flavin-dependent dehydrogenase
LDGPLRGYPLRCDFVTAPTFGDRLLLVGESAGLVNPLTGEGINYALESGKIAAEHLLSLFETGDFSPRQFATYDKLLRQRYQRRFIFCNWIRDLLVNRLWIDWLIQNANQHETLKSQLMKLVLG